MILGLCSFCCRASSFGRSEAYATMLESKHRRGGPISLTTALDPSDPSRFNTLRQNPHPARYRPLPPLLTQVPRGRSQKSITTILHNPAPIGAPDLFPLPMLWGVAQLVSSGDVYVLGFSQGGTRRGGVDKMAVQVAPFPGVTMALAYIPGALSRCLGGEPPGELESFRP